MKTPLSSTNSIQPYYDHTARFMAVVVLLMAVMLLFPIRSDAGEDGSSDGPLPADLTEMALEQLMAIEVTTISGASRYEQPINQAPAAVTVITAEEIKRYGYRHLADVLQSVPGFSITNDRNYQYAGIRGFGLLGDYGTRMLLLVDGIRQNEAISESGYVGQQSVDVDLIERVEVIRGPGHTLYGANALLAVVNIITKRGRDLNGTELSGEAGSFATYKGRMSYGRRFNGDLELLLSGSFLHSAGQDLYFREFDTPATNFGWARNGDREQAGSAFLKLAYRDLTLEASYTNRTKGIPTAPWGTVFNDSRTETTDASMFVDLKYQHTFDNDLDMMGRISWNKYWYDGRYLYDSEPPEPPYRYSNYDKQRATWLMGELQLTGQIGEHHRLVGGLEFRHVLRLDQENHDEGSSPVLNSRETAWNMGGYLQDEYQILDELTLTTGIRFDYFDTFGSTINPRVAVIYTPWSRTALKLLFGTAFRPPSAYEMYYADGNTQKTNPDLREESSLNGEVILEHNFGKGLRASLSGYYTRIRDMITLVTDPNDNLLVFRNVDTAELLGMELTLTTKLENGVQGRFSYTLQDARNADTGQWLANSARHLAKLNVTIPLVADKLFFGIEEQYTSCKRTLSDRRTADFFLTNVTLFSQNLLKDLELSASVYNLFNSASSVPAGEEHTQDVIRQDGRSVRIKATWRF